MVNPVPRHLELKRTYELYFFRQLVLNSLLAKTLLIVVDTTTIVKNLSGRNTQVLIDNFHHKNVNKLFTNTFQAKEAALVAWYRYNNYIILQFEKQKNYMKTTKGFELVKTVTFPNCKGFFHEI